MYNKQIVSLKHVITKMLILNYKGQYNWPFIHDFLAKRAIAGIEEIGENYYRRQFQWQDTRGLLIAKYNPERNCFNVSIQANRDDQLEPVIANLSRVLDLDADSDIIENHLIQAGVPADRVQPGIRLPGAWSLFEAGCRAILGQQISLIASIRLLHNLVAISSNQEGSVGYFPTPKQVSDSALDQLKMPEARKRTLAAFALYMAEHSDTQDPDDWINIKGIGPWTIAYAKMRGRSNPDIWLGTDLVIKKMNQKIQLNVAEAEPWRSYLTVQLWSMA